MPLKICVLLTHTTDGQTWFFALDSKWTETPLNFSASLFEAIFCPFLPNWGARMRFELNFVLCSGKVEQATVFALKQVCVRPFNSVYFQKGRQQKNLMKIYHFSWDVFQCKFIRFTYLCVEVENPNIREFLNCLHLSKLESLNGKTSPQEAE